MSNFSFEDREDFSRINMAMNLISNAISQLEQVDNSFLRSSMQHDVEYLKDAVFTLKRLEERKV